MKSRIGIIIIALKLLNVHICAMNISFKKPTFQGSSSQELIEENRKQIKRFLKNIKTEEDLWKPLPFPSCRAPAVFDLTLHRRNMDLLEIIVAKKISLHVLRWTADSLFEWLARNGKSKVILEIIKLHEKYQLDINPLINPVTNDEKIGDTPLMAACFHGHRECVRILLENGADISPATPFFRKTALEFAIDHHQRGLNKTTKIVKLLCGAGANSQHACQRLRLQLAKDTQMRKARQEEFLETINILQAYSLHDSKSTYFSLLPVDLLISCFQDYKPEIT